MKQFHDIIKGFTASPDYAPILRFVKPLKDHFGINHFWYTRITSEGKYSHFGTHREWTESCLEAGMVDHFATLRHPALIQEGVSQMKPSGDEKFKKVLDWSWDKYRVHFNLSLNRHLPDGVECFGFATHFNDARHEETLLNEVSLLTHFVNLFKKKFEKFICSVNEVQVDLAAYLGPAFYEHPKGLKLPIDRALFLKQIGVPLPNFTSREIDLLLLLSHGFPASYMAEMLHLSPRTVENYLAGLKLKLQCKNKVELIQKVRDIASTGYLGSWKQ